jgi:NitT/TauT family transport system ATP-binding protein
MHPENSKPYIDLLNVTKIYPSKDGERIGVTNINMTVQKDELVAVVGHSGCGKTTLLNLISGIVSPTSGSVKIDGVGIHEPQSNCGFVFQEFSLFPWRTVIENVEFGLEIRGINGAQRRKTAKEYLELVGLLNVSDSYPDVLSGGMKQRVAIARALAYNPNILLMDEPFGALDSQTREEMQEELLKIWNDTHKTIIFVTHSIREAVFLAKRVFLMKFPQNTIHRIYDVALTYPRDLKTKISKEMNELVFEIATDLKSSN